MKLSVALAVFNEEQNIKACLESVRGIADEIIVVDGGSADKTVEISKSYGAKVIVTDNPPIFHINKQKANEKASGEWILQLDADERVGNELAEEIRKIVQMDQEQLEKYQDKLPQKKLFLRHQRLLEQRDGQIGTKEGEIVAFFLPRLNFFLGKYLRFGGVYPDGVIRLFKKNKAYLPCKDVHEQYVVKGRVGWTKNCLLHVADPTFKRYLMRNSRYIDLIVREFHQNKIGKNFFQLIYFCLLKPFWWFFMTQIRHKGILDGRQGIIFSFFSALRFPRAYIRYLLS